jgi:hypothetical protein
MTTEQMDWNDDARRRAVLLADVAAIRRMVVALRLVGGQVHDLRCEARTAKEMDVPAAAAAAVAAAVRFLGFAQGARVLAADCYRQVMVELPKCEWSGIRSLSVQIEDLYETAVGHVQDLS